MLEKVLDWCEAYQVYAVIDLHAAAGAQSCLPCDDGPDNAPHLFLDEESGAHHRALRGDRPQACRRWIVGAMTISTSRSPLWRPMQSWRKS